MAADGNLPAVVQITAADAADDPEVAAADDGRTADPGDRAGVADADITEFGGQVNRGKRP